jgi:hypothetical protein
MKVKVKFSYRDSSGKKQWGGKLIHADYAIEYSERKVQEEEWLSYSIPSLRHSDTKQNETFSGEHRIIVCNCGEEEVMDINEDLSRAKNFQMIMEMTDGEGIFECPECGSEVESKIVE